MAARSMALPPSLMANVEVVDDSDVGVRVGEFGQPRVLQSKDEGHPRRGRVELNTEYAASNYSSRST